MANVVEIILKLTDQASGKLDGVSKKFKTIGSDLARVGKGLTIGVTAPLVAAGGLALKAASDYEQAMGAVSSVFEDAQQIIIDFSKTSATAVGLSAASFSQLSVVTGSFLQNVGFSAAEAAKETINLTERAADMSAMFGGDVANALNAIQSGLKGEFNPLEQFGVKINQAAINARALEMGLEDATGAINDNAKAGAALDLIYEQTAKAQGTFVDEADSFEGMMKILKAQLSDIGKELGTHIMPIAMEFMGVLSNLVTKFGELSPETQKFIVYAGMIAAALGPVLFIVGQLITVFGSIAGAISTVSTFVGASLVPAFATATPVLLATVAAAIPVIAAFAAIGAAIYLLYRVWKDNFMGVQEITKMGFAIIKIEMERFAETWNQVWDNFILILTIALDQTYQVALQIVENIKDAFDFDWHEFGRNLVSAIADGIRDGLQWVVDAARAVAQAALDAAKEVLGIHSPSAAMMDIGLNMNRGLAAGLEDTRTAPTNALLQLARDSNALAADRASTVNVYGNANSRMDITALAHEVASLLGGG